MDSASQSRDQGGEAESLTAFHRPKGTTMSLKLKVLGLGLLATLAMSAVAVMNASATSSGHFISDAADGHTIVNQSIEPESPHGFNVSVEGGSIECDEANVQGTATTNTLTAVEGIMTLGKCHTTGSEPGTTVVHMNGCSGRGTSNSSGTGTGHLLCPAGKTVVVTHPNCTITVPPQSGVGGFTYTNVNDGSKHTITVDVNLQYAVQYHAGICIFTGTNHTATVSGSTIVKATNTQGEQVNITST